MLDRHISDCYYYRQLDRKVPERRMTAGRMDVRMGCLLWLIFIQLCSAQATECKVTQDGEKTTYTIKDAPHDLDKETSDCEYSWANGTDHVLANNEDKMPVLVMTNSIATLVTSECICQIVYTRSCMSEPERYKANCTSECGGNVGRLKDEGISKGWIAAVVTVVVLVAIGLLVLLCYKCRNKCPRGVHA